MILIPAGKELAAAKFSELHAELRGRDLEQRLFPPATVVYRHSNEKL